MWCIDQFYTLFWIRLESGTACCLSWRYLHWLDIEIVYCVFDTEKLILSKWWEHTAETLGEEFKLAENIWWREPTILWVLDYEIHWHCEDNGHIGSSYLSESFVMRCFGIVRTIPTSSSSWPRIIHLILWCAFYRSWEDFGYLHVDDIVLRRLWSTLWIGYYSGRKTSAIQLYLADLHWQCRTEHSILHWGSKLWDVISMWKADLEKERCVLTMFCIQKKVVQIPCVNHFVLEKLASKLTNGLVIHVRMRTSLIWELLEVFRCFWIHLVKLSFVDL